MDRGLSLSLSLNFVTALWIVWAIAVVLFIVVHHLVARQGGPRSLSPASVGWAFLLAALAIGDVLYVHSAGGATTDSPTGLLLGYLSAGCLAVSALLLPVYRLWIRRHAWGSKRHWVEVHLLLAALGLVLAVLHAAGNFHPRSGTYALLALLALLVSGVVGQLLDRHAMRLAKHTSWGRLPAWSGSWRSVPSRRMVAIGITQVWRQVHRLLTMLFLLALIYHLVSVALLWYH